MARSEQGAAAERKCQDHASDAKAGERPGGRGLIVGGHHHVAQEPAPIGGRGEREQGRRRQEQRDGHRAPEHGGRVAGLC